MYFIKMYRARKNGLFLPRSFFGCKPFFRPLYSVFTVTFSRSGESSVKPNILPMYGVRPAAARVLGGGLRRRGGVVVGRHGRRVVDLLWLLDVRGLGRWVRNYRRPVAREERRCWAREVGWLEECINCAKPKLRNFSAFGNITSKSNGIVYHRKLKIKNVLHAPQFQVDLATWKQ